MLTMQSLSEMVRTLKLAGVLVSTAALFACAGDDGAASSSSSSSTSSSSSSSNSSTSSSSSSSSTSSSSSSSSSGATSVRVQAQDFVRYNELNSQREGAASGTCAAKPANAADLVDTTDQNGVCAIGYVTSGEWVEWDVAGLNPGVYRMVLRIASANSGRAVQVSINGTSVGQTTTVGGGWDSYGDRAIENINIPSANVAVRTTFPNGEVNLNYFDLVRTGNLSSSSSSSSSTSSSSSSSSSTSSSSSSSSTSSSSSSSSSGGVRYEDADLAAGLTRFNSSCGTCHMHQGGGEFTALTSPKFKIQEALTRRGGFAGLVAYVDTNMPFGNPGACDATCSLNTAAYMVSLGSTTPTDPVEVSCNASDPLSYGIRTVKLLTRNELKNSLIDLGLAVDSDFSDDPLPPDSPLTKSSYPVHMHVKIAVDETRNGALMAFAEKVASSAASRLRQSSNCGTNATNCANAFLTKLEQIFRRPITDNNERSAYTSLFTQYGAEEGMTLAITAAITAPQFLYRSELGIPVSQARQQNLNIGTTANGQSKLQLADSDAYVLDNYEFASALAYMYTGSTPDATLLAAARNNTLATEAQINTQIDRLLQTTRGRQHMAEFGANWMRADDVLRATRPSFSNVFTGDIQKDMAREVRELFSYVFFTDSVPFEQFYSGDFTVVNRRLAQYYGYNSFSGGDSDWRVTNIPNRGGIITTGAFMTANADNVSSGPIKRAVDVRELMLCHHIGAPPNDLASDQTRAALIQQVQSELNQGNMTTRRYFEAITDSESCASCHETMINPLFGMDDFDQIGRYRTTEKGRGDNGINGLQIDTSGELIGLSDVYDTANVLAFNGAKDLGKKISTLPSVRECLIVNSFRFATGLPIDEDSYSRQSGGGIDEPVRLTSAQKEDYACAKEQLREVYTSSSSSPKSVYRKIGTLDLIRLRKPIASSQVNQ